MDVQSQVVLKILLFWVFQDAFESLLFLYLLLHLELFLLEFHLKVLLGCSCFVIQAFLNVLEPQDAAFLLDLGFTSGLNECVIELGICAFGLVILVV